MGQMGKTSALFAVGVMLAVMIGGCGSNVTSTQSSSVEVTSSEEEGGGAMASSEGVSGGEGAADAGTEDAAPEDTTPVSETIYADIDIDGYGIITVELDPSAAPISVENFVNLAESGFYEGTTFHRIMEGFMMQGGANPNRTTDPIKGEFKSNGVDNPISHKRGVISMARTQIPDSATSQFFIVHRDSTFLDGDYAAFGYVTEGMDIVDRICEESEPIDNNGTIPENEQPVMNGVRIRRE